jgi:hypothetical protein
VLDIASDLASFGGVLVLFLVPLGVAAIVYACIRLGGDE